ncbi:MFS transporter [Streptomyces sp. NPDC056431]|uniref:MFS transporter n=1 Tax=Streptomyces sp. NPDC056431 TaxID=3345814 RepID=UPI0036C45AE3
MSTPAVPAPSRWWLVTAAGLAVFVAQLDASVVGVAAPTIRSDLGTTTEIVQWVSLAYAVPLIGLSLCAGRWVDLADPRRALTLACGGFALFSVACGLAPSIGWLIAARVVQGCFAVVMMALTPVLATVAVAPGARGRAFGLVMLFGTLGGLAGPVLGGQIVEHADWPWIFYLGVPAAALVIALAARELPKGERLPWPERRWLVEALTLGGAAVAVLLGLTFAVDRGAAWGQLALLAVPLVVAWSRRKESAAVRRLVGSPGVLGPHLALLLAYLGIFLIMFMVPFLLQDTLGVTAGTTGLALIALAVSTAVAGLLGGRAADRLGARGVALTGALLTAAGAALMLTVDGSSGAASLAWRLAVLGFGFGLFNGQNQVLAMGNTPPDRLGMTAGTTNLVRQLGVAFGSALGALVWSTADSGTTGFRLGAGVGTLLVAGVAVTVLVAVRAPEPAGKTPVETPA